MAFEHYIEDASTYDAEMRRSLADKAWWVNAVSASVIVDFGCGDGSTIEFLQQFFPHAKFIGVDISEEMLHKARQRCPTATFVNTLLDARDVIPDYSTVCVVCNSVIHEVYSYADSLDLVDQFWRDLFFNLNPDYIVIRDMMLSEKASRPAHPLQVARIRASYYQRELQDFESHWGSIADNHNMIHFLLKYRYASNWKREVRENYFPLSVEKFLLLNQAIGYDLQEFHHEPVAFLDNLLNETFGFRFPDPTHVKAILRRK